MSIFKLDFGTLKEALDKGVQYDRDLNKYIEPGRFLISIDHTHKPDDLNNISGILEVTLELRGSTTYIQQEYKGNKNNADSQHFYSRTSTNALGTNWTVWRQHTNSSGGHVDGVLKIQEAQISGNTSITGSSTLNGPLAVNNTATINSLSVTANANIIGTITGTTATFSNNVEAPFFNGTAYRAQLGDIAEYYTISPKEKETAIVGSVIEVNSDDIDNYEVRIPKAINSSNIIGVVSNTAAIEMSDYLKDESSVLVGLLGKVKVRVVGLVKKGDKLIAFEDGTAISVNSSYSYLIELGMNSFADYIQDSNNEINTIGIALETNLDTYNEKLILALIK
jgi:hypothetical protein